MELKRKPQSGLISTVRIKPLAPDSSTPEEEHIIVRMA